MSTEFDAAIEIRDPLDRIDQNLDRIYADMPSQRERIATAAMQGLLAAGALSNCTVKHVAGDAVLMADALITELIAEAKGESA